MEIVPPTINHKYTIIFLHGRDSDAAEFKTDFFESQASDDRTLQEILQGIKWVLPNSGMLYSKGLDQDISQWFDMSSTQRPHEDSSEQQIELDRAVKRILDIVDEEAVIVGADNVILAGISQGCAVAARSLLKVECMIGGFIGLSSWFPEADSEVQAEGSVNETPIFLAHCQDDGVIAIKYGEELKGQLEGYGFDVEWHRYEDGGHWLNEPKGVDDLVRFIRRALNIAPS